MSLVVLLNDKFIYNAEKDIQRMRGKRKTKKKTVKYNKIFYERN